VYNLAQNELMNKILQLRPHFEIYALRFLIIGVYWNSYHQSNYYYKTHMYRQVISNSKTIL
ncbi:MAG: TMEM175 family protein, partial [Nitrososphaeraceae archaeon]